MERKYWIILGLGILVILYLRRRVEIEDSEAARATRMALANRPPEGTGYYNAAAYGLESPFAASSPYAGTTLMVDITPNMPANNLPYDPQRDAIVR